MGCTYLGFARPLPEAALCPPRLVLLPHLVFENFVCRDIDPGKGATPADIFIMGVGLKNNTWNLFWCIHIVDYIMPKRGGVIC